MKSKLKSRTPPFDVLYPVASDIVGQSTGNNLYFPMVPFFFCKQLQKSVEKVIFLSKVPENDRFLTQIFLSTEPGIREKTDFHILI